MPAGRPRKKPVSTMTAYHAIRSLDAGMDREKVKSKYNIGERQMRMLEAGEKKRKKLRKEPLPMPIIPNNPFTARQAIIKAAAQARLRHGLPPAAIKGSMKRVPITQDMIDEVEKMSA